MNDPIRRYRPTLANDCGDEQLWKHVVVLTHDPKGPAVLHKDAVERIEVLEKALCGVAERVMPDCTPCFCFIPDGHAFIHHEEWCVDARKALEASK